MDVTALALTVELEVDAPANEVFDAVTDPTRVPRWSPECVHVEWLDGATAAAPGTKFFARNQAGSWEWDVTCEVIEVRQPRTFSWIVVGLHDPSLPSSTWRYELTDRPGGGTLITQSFHHGAGGSHLVTAMETEPDHAESLYEFRRGVLLHNIDTTLRAMAAEFGWLRE
ncbi:SRPBCC family protein [Lentzea sp. NPDC058450]|uniref:SRPBCC family protein n=1 Tax=Lentzea sp. NPDC058450 TaxID=3346505 RepID=UPI00365BF1A2